MKTLLDLYGIRVSRYDGPTGPGSAPPETLHERIAEKLGWTIAETKQLSLPALRDMVRPVSPKLAHEIGLIIQSGSHIRGSRARPPSLLDLYPAVPTPAAPMLRVYQASDFDNTVIALVKERDALVARIAARKPSDDPDVLEFDEFLRDRLNGLEMEILDARRVVDARIAREEERGDFQTQVRVDEAVRKLDQKHALENAEALAAAVRDAGGPERVRAWHKSGVGARVYFPGEIGYIGVGSDGSLHEIMAGRQVFYPSGMYPSWRNAVKTGRDAYRKGQPERTAKQTDERVALVAKIRKEKA